MAQVHGAKCALQAKNQAVWQANDVLQLKCIEMHLQMHVPSGLPAGRDAVPGGESNEYSAAPGQTSGIC